MTKQGEYFAVAAPGLEPLLAAELAALGAVPRVTQGGVEFDGDAGLLYAANLHVRTGSRIVVRIASFRARTFHELERHAKKVPWSRFVQRGGSVALRVTARKSKLYHERAIAERLMTALSQSVAGVTQRTAHADEDDAEDAHPAQLFIVRFMRDECVISADASGALLHRRGYRQAVAKAPLRETLAAALLVSAGWDGTTALVDPMCGSGTIPIEAALLARRIPPGLASDGLHPRAYAFEQWPEFDATKWRTVVEEARAAVLPEVAVPIVGSDRDAGAITSAIANAARAGVADDVVFEKAALSAANIPDATAWLVTNPPYGVRVGTGDQRDLYAALGTVVREKLTAGRAVLLTPEPMAARQSGLRLDPLVETRNGGIVVRIVATPRL